MVWPFNAPYRTDDNYEVFVGGVLLRHSGMWPIREHATQQLGNQKAA